MSEPIEFKAGRITSIRAQSKAPDRVSVYIDGAFAFGIHRDLLLEFELRKDLMLDVALQCRIVERDTFFRARAAAFRLLSYRSRTAAEIRRRLERASYAGTVAEAVASHLAEKGIVDDEAFARSFAELALRSKGYGPSRVRAELLRKGVAPSTIERTIDEVFGERDEVLTKARELARKRWGRLQREDDDRKRRKKMHDYLARRGYGYEMIHQIIGELQHSRP